MKKTLLVAAVLVAVLAFLAIPNSQAGAGKSIRWKATVTGPNLIGSGDFVGGVDHVNINNGFGTNEYSCGITGNSYSYIELQVFTPSLTCYMDPNSIFGPIDALNNALCGFPKTNAAWPGCVAYFLNNNNPHPTADYPHIILRFTTCGCENTKMDLMAMGEGEILPVRMSILFFSHIWGCPPSSPFTQKTFLNLNMNAHGWYSRGLLSLPDIYIKRVGNAWTAYVDTVFDNPHYQDVNLDSASADWPVMKSDNILGQYASCDPGPVKKGKATWITTYHYPTAKAPLKFQIAFTKY